MISVEEAFEKVVTNAAPLPGERVGLHTLNGRVAAEDVYARRTQPGADMSAMDGYAVRSDDLVKGQPLLVLPGESAAGKPFSGQVDAGQTVRIFTGAIVPDGADQVVIQENVTRTDDLLTTTDKPDPDRNIRKAGIDL